MGWVVELWWFEEVEGIGRGLFVTGHWVQDGGEGGGVGCE